MLIERISLYLFRFLIYLISYILYFSSDTYLLQCLLHLILVSIWFFSLNQNPLQASSKR